VTLYPAIQNFTSADVTPQVTQCVIDWTNVYPYQLGSPYQIARFNFSTGVEISHGFMPGTTSNGSCIIDPNGFLYARQSLANYNGLSQANGATYALTSTFGVGSAFNQAPLNIPCPNVLTVLSIGPSNPSTWIATTAEIPLGVDQHSINIVSANGPLAYGGHSFSMVGGSWSQCAGHQDSNSATAWTLGGPSGTAPIPNAVNLYKTVIPAAAAGYTPVPVTGLINPYITSSLVVTYGPTDIDSGWTDIGQNGVCYDQTDGNLLIIVSTSGSHAANAYVVKLRSNDGSIVWKVPLAHGTINSTNQFPFCRIRHGTLALVISFGPTNTLYVINTISGAFTTSTTGLGSLFVQGQCYDDTTGAILCNTSYSAGAGAPTQIGSTPSSFSGWAALYVQPQYAPPPKARTYNWSTYYVPAHRAG
jgi:hypothetical protein